MIVIATDILVYARRTALISGRATGNLAHDAHIAAVLLEHGVRELWTADRDFDRFPGLKVRHPFGQSGWGAVSQIDTPSDAFLS